MIVLSLGCNIGERLSNLREGLRLLSLLSEVNVLRVSPVYESEPLMFPDSPETWNNPYVNAAVSISTELEPKQLLDQVKGIEKKMGRKFDDPRWSPRVMDIDILVWHDKYCKDEFLEIPHSGIVDRPFVLWPLSDLDPDWKYCVPNRPETGKTVEELVKKLGSRFDGKAPLGIRQIAHRIDTPLMVGILNLTPDSFSDGGRFDKLELAVRQAEILFEAGADIIDVGAESTRPFSKPIGAEEEWSRLNEFLYVWEDIWLGKSFKPMLSIDTYRSETIEKALDYKFDFINDVSGFVDENMQKIAKLSNAKIIFMHNLGIPVDPKVVLPDGKDIVSEVYRWGEEQLEKLVRLGINEKRLIFDVGIGFGKTAEQSLCLIRNIDRFHDLGVPILVGHSRKSFLNIFTDKNVIERDLETAAFSCFLSSRKVDYLRVHNVDQNMRLLKLSVGLCNLN